MAQWPGFDCTTTRHGFFLMDGDRYVDRVGARVTPRIPFFSTQETSGFVGVRVAADLMHREDVARLRATLLKVGQWILRPTRHDTFNLNGGGILLLGFNGPEIASCSAIHDQTYDVILRTFGAICDFLKTTKVEIP
ncbi:hypothetical protein PM082_021279 [Marasmius tenuissimus]|nr:hypothetical protein PM082_021279 [Marasmius tenuissimus]